MQPTVTDIADCVADFKAKLPLFLTPLSIEPDYDTYRIQFCDEFLKHIQIAQRKQRVDSLRLEMSLRHQEYIAMASPHPANLQHNQQG
jgi:hypothetical protein